MICEYSEADTPYRFPMGCQSFILIYEEAKEPDVYADGLISKSLGHFPVTHPFHCQQ